MLKKIYSILLILTILFSNCINMVYAENSETPPAPAVSPTINARSALLMEQSTGKILYEQNPDEKLAPASVTKVMTILLIYDCVAQGKIKWEDNVTISEHAASMGGSQIFLEPNEQQTVKTLTKSIVVASANDAAVAMAEYIGGSEQGFVSLMNEKAKALGMNNTNFENACGLDSDNHYTSARDIAIMSRELITKYPDVKEFTKIWQDTITHVTKKGSQEFGLTNTNKLLKWYNGATGLKTGSTGKALYCLSGTAERDNLSLIAVVMAAPDPKVRFQEVMKMLDYGFANYTTANGEPAGKSVGEINVYKGDSEKVKAIVKDEIKVVVEKSNSKQIESKIELLDGLKAPFEQGTKAGEIIYYYENTEVGRSDLITDKAVDKAGLNDIMQKLLIKWFS